MFWFCEFIHELDCSSYEASPSITVYGGLQPSHLDSFLPSGPLAQFLCLVSAVQAVQLWTVVGVRLCNVVVNCYSRFEIILKSCFCCPICRETKGAGKYLCYISPPILRERVYDEIETETRSNIR